MLTGEAYYQNGKMRTAATIPQHALALQVVNTSSPTKIRFKLLVCIYEATEPIDSRSRCSIMALPAASLNLF